MLSGFFGTRKIYTEIVRKPGYDVITLFLFHNFLIWKFIMLIFGEIFYWYVCIVLHIYCIVLYYGIVLLYGIVLCHGIVLYYCIVCPIVSWCLFGNKCNLFLLSSQTGIN